MTDEFRKIESALREFFEHEGPRPTAAGGEYYVGACSASTNTKVIDGLAKQTVIIREGPDLKVVNISDLARAIAAL